MAVIYEGVVRMSVSDWISVPDNPRQRDTEKRAEIAMNGYLRELAYIHRYVFASTIDGEIACKLDGHTRAFLWKDGCLDCPDEIIVLTVPVGSLEEAKLVYDQLDSPQAGKKPSDFVFGACRENDFRLTSRLLSDCAFSTQLRLAEYGAVKSHDIYDLVKKWKKHLIDLDGFDLSSKYKIVVSAMLCAIRRDGPQIASRFFVALDRGEGSQDPKTGMDGIAALAHHLDIRWHERTTSGYDNVMDLSARAWYAYNCWRDGKRIRDLYKVNIPREFRVRKRKKVKI